MPALCLTAALFDGTAKCPESLCPVSVLPPTGETCTPSPARTLLLYIRAERASLPLHAPDMLAVRIQAIDGTRTSTLLDSQPCRPLHSPTTDAGVPPTFWPPQQPLVSWRFSLRARQVAVPIAADHYLPQTAPEYSKACS